LKGALKWAGIGLGGLLGLVVVVVAALYFMGSARLSRAYEIQIAAIDIPNGEESIARGRHLAEAVTACKACHGENLAGDLLFAAPGIATVYASNLTPGRGGIGAIYSDTDYVRAIRHGVNSEGRGLLIMHSDLFHNLSEEDLAAIIAYVKSVPPVDHEVPRTSVAPLGRVMVALGLFDSETAPLIAAETIDHAAPFEAAPAQGPTDEYGRYLTSITLCSLCHGVDLKGGPSLDEGAPPGPNITALVAPGGWTEEQFVASLRTGVTPSGRSLNPEWMPWEMFMKMTDEEMAALYAYLVSLQ
jgi:cytochrome c553